MKCAICGEEFLRDEMVGININDEIVSIDEESMELNAQNPDYCIATVCIDCSDESNGITEQV